MQITSGAGSSGLPKGGTPYGSREQQLRSGSVRADHTLATRQCSTAPTPGHVGNWVHFLGTTKLCSVVQCSPVWWDVLWGEELQWDEVQCANWPRHIEKLSHENK